MLYVLLCLIIALAMVLIASYAPRSTPTRCRCGQRADIQDDDRPWIGYCAACHIKRLKKKGIEV